MNETEKTSSDIEKKSHAYLFWGSSILLVISSIWVLEWEFIDLRPWKKYQKDYIDLSIEKLQERLDLLRDQRSNQDFDSRYNEALSKLEAEKAKFESPEVQTNVKQLQSVISQKDKGLKKVTKDFQDTRGEYLEIEYLYFKNLNPEDKNRLVALDKESGIFQQQQGLIQQEIDSLKTILAELRVPVEKAEADVRAMEANVTDIENEIKNLKNQPIEIKQMFMEDVNKADRCTSCHMGIGKEDEVSNIQPFSSHPGKYIFLDNHPSETFGCTLCHQGEGRATTEVWKAHGEDEFWTEPMLQGHLTQATCQNCHGDVKKLNGADILIKGVELVEKHGCYGCHQIAGFEGLRKIGPDLTFVGQKNNYSWIIQWIQEPESYLPGARMPNFQFSEETVKSIADYLVSMTSEFRKDEPQSEVDWDRYDRGQALWGISRCSICHVTNGLGGANKKAFAPELTKVGSKINKEWMFNWLKDPKQYFTETKMPRFRFTDEEILDLVEYITGEFVDWDFEPQYTVPEKITQESINKGKELIQEFGCFGCHNVKGMEDLMEIGPFLRGREVTYFSQSELNEMVGAELTGIGVKPFDRFDFGMVKNIEKNRVSYLKHKLKEPRSFRENLKMPVFGFKDDEIDALVTLLIGFTDKDLPARFKRPKATSLGTPQGDFGDILNDVKCLTCHTINGEGEDFAPDLSIEGSKVQKEWLQEFLEKPDVIRPMLQQMPRFRLNPQPNMIKGNLKPSEIEIITLYIENVLVSDDIPDYLPEDDRDLKTQISDGEKLYFDTGCNACHQIGSEGGALGPNLSNVGNRLKPGYIYARLKDPQKFKADIVEPNYRFSESELISLAQFLLTLKEK